VLPPDGRPVVSREWDSPDEPYRKIYEGVKAVVRELRRSTQEPSEKIREIHRRSSPTWRQLTFVAVFAMVAVVSIWGVMLYSPSLQTAQNQDMLSPESSNQLDTASAISTVAREKAGEKKSEPAQKLSSQSVDKNKPVSVQTPIQPEEKPKPPVIDPVEKPKFDRQLPAVEGMARVIKDRKQGFLNTATGQVIGWYDDAENFNDGRAYVKQNNRYFWIDKTGRCVENCQ